MLRILTLCHGNICRSPLAEVLIEAAIAADQELAGRISVSSAGTSDEHVGEGMHPHSASVLRSRRLRTTHRARQYTPAVAATVDLVLAADRANLRLARALHAAADRHPEVRLLRDFDQSSTGQDLDDPWGEPIAAYERTATAILAAIPGLLSELRGRL